MNRQIALDAHGNNLDYGTPAHISAEATSVTDTLFGFDVRGGVKHPTSSALIFDENERVLLVAHRALGLWLPPGGHAIAGEDPVECLRREINEEVALDFEIIDPGEVVLDGFSNVRSLPRPLALLLVAVYDGKAGHHTHVDSLYLGRASSLAIKLQEEELSDAGWFHAEEFSAIAKIPELPTLASVGLAEFRRYMCHS